MQEAWDYVMAKAGTADKKRRKVQTFGKALQDTKTHFEMLEVTPTSRQIRRIAVDSLKVFGNLMPYVHLPQAARPGDEGARRLAGRASRVHRRRKDSRAS